MTLQRCKPSGFGPNDELTSVEMEFLDEQMPDAIDGAGGSAGTPYSPSTAVIIDGANGFEFRSPLKVTSAGYFDFNLGDLSISTSGFITGGGFVSLFQGDVTIASPRQLAIMGTLAVAGSSAVFSGCSADFDLGFTVGPSGVVTVNSAAAWTFSNTPVFANGFTTSTAGTATFNRPAVFASGSTITISGTARIAYRYAVGVDATHTYSVADVDIIRVPTMTAPRTYVITSTGAAAGNVMEVRLATASGTDLLSVVRDDASTLATLQRGTRDYTRLVFDGTNWQTVFTGLTA